MLRNIAILFIFLTFIILPHANAKPEEKQEILAFTGATIYPSPTDPPISNGTVLIRDGKIAAVGPKIKFSQDVTVINCAGMFITGAFQNSHVHFTQQKWENASTISGHQLNKQMQEMLTRYGFTTVVDTGSFLENTLGLRARIESGELQGPRILTAGSPIYPVDGVPYYVKDSLPPNLVALLPTPKTKEDAVAIVRGQFEKGSDVLKLFTGSYVKGGKVLPMNAEIASTAATEAHLKGKLVFAHASNVAGLEIALKAGVDVVAHALDDDRGFNESHIARMKAIRMSMIPTLKLFEGPKWFEFVLKEVSDFYHSGGQILFGTDVGFMEDYDPTEEYELLARAGMNWKHILASLTTAPAERFGESKTRGRINPGLDADIVVLAADPAKDIKAFSNVRYTIRAGHIIYRAE